MRLWSIHPQYLDPQGLVALWREALLAQAVLRGETRGYRNHPQLDRFQQHAAPLAAISHYLQTVYAEATRRGYRFNAGKIHPATAPVRLAVSSGQVQYEWVHLMRKLHARSPQLHQQWRNVDTPQLHPLFTLHHGPVAEWERM
ncbi:MAG: DNA lyase [Brachymonas sp.]|nr:DNA lyase [Brachymonas sp.]